MLPYSHDGAPWRRIRRMMSNGLNDVDTAAARLHVMKTAVGQTH